MEWVGDCDEFGFVDPWWSVGAGQGGRVQWSGGWELTDRMWDTLESKTVANGHEVEGAYIRYKQLLTKVKLYSRGAADTVLAHSQ